MEIISQAKQFYGKSKVAVSKNMTKAERKEARETNLAIERAAIIMADLEKFSGKAGQERLSQAEKDVEMGLGYYFDNAKDELKTARKLPRKTKEEREIRSDAIKNARIKKEAAALIRKYGAENIHAPSETVKEEIINRETHSFFESLQQKRDLRAYLKSASVYSRVTKPYTDAVSLIEQARNYTHYSELEKKYSTVETE